MTPTLHPQLLSAFLDGKSCATIAKTFSLSVEEVLAWFESDLTQSTLRRIESLQLQQARIVSFSVLPAATGSLSRTSATAPDPVLQTRAASNLLRLGLRFSQSHRDTSETPAPREGAGGGPPSLTTGAADTHGPTRTARAPHREIASQSSPPPRAHKSAIAAPSQTPPTETLTPATLLSRRESLVGALQNLAGVPASFHSMASHHSAQPARHTPIPLAQDPSTQDRPPGHPRDRPHAASSRNSTSQFQVSSAA
ncbi:MAG: hypothetical protein KF805_13680 [Phycisphaeraceae bacterium]|nr:hypothetical protein [Phycisphaeraceae bacterium]